jgi:hypothetical protein
MITKSSWMITAAGALQSVKQFGQKKPLLYLAK